MFCFKCGANMPDDSTVCPQCATPVQTVPTPPPPPQASASNPAATSAWLNVPAAPQNPQQGQYPPQAQPYRGQQQPPSDQQTDGKATASLVLGILSLLCLSILAGIPAVILGHMSKANIRRSMGRLKGDGMATAGLVMGYLSAAAIPLILIIAAIAIPNLLRAKISANESAAASTVRTINVSQITYSTQYPDHGYASDLATLGPGPSGSCGGEGTAEHACLLDNIVGGSQCTAGQWCAKAGYNYSVSGVCNSAGVCSNYVVAAIPMVFESTGRKRFCSTSDSVIRVRSSGSSSTPPTADECAEWPPFS
jgi:type IV pilus assembly protein PilA